MILRTNVQPRDQPNDLWLRHRESVEQRWADTADLDGRQSPYAANGASTSQANVGNDLAQVNCLHFSFSCTFLFKI